MANLSVRFAYPGYSSVNPRLENPDLYVLHVSTEDLFVSIQNIVVGNSSSLYQWDPLSESFVLPTTSDGKQMFIVVDGKDDLLMQRYGLLTGLLVRFFPDCPSYTNRFLAIGGLLRRLDLFVNSLRRRYVTSNDGCLNRANSSGSQL
jgi:hypothetical protein